MGEAEEGRKEEEDKKRRESLRWIVCVRACDCVWPRAIFFHLQLAPFSDSKGNLAGAGLRAID